MNNYTVTITDGKEYRTFELATTADEFCTWSEWLRRSGIEQQLPSSDWSVIDITNEDWFRHTDVSDVDGLQHSEDFSEEQEL